MSLPAATKRATLPIALTKWLKEKNLQIFPFSPGAVSSVVEHFLDTEGVRGSNPLSRTISNKI